MQFSPDFSFIFDGKFFFIVNRSESLLALKFFGYVWRGNGKLYGAAVSKCPKRVHVGMELRKAVEI